jgi:hypothetical protein
MAGAKARGGRSAEPTATSAVHTKNLQVNNASNVYSDISHIRGNRKGASSKISTRRQQSFSTSTVSDSRNVQDTQATQKRVSRAPL